MISSPFQIEVDQVSPSQWSELLTLFADANIYQTWAYGEVRWGQRALSHLVMRQDDEVVAIAQLRIATLGPVKAGVAYLRWGPLFHRKGMAPDPIVVRAMASAIRHEYMVKRGLFLRILPIAFEETPRANLLSQAFSELEREPFAAGQTYRTIVLSLTPPIEELRRRLDQKWRNQLNRAEKNGLTIKQGTSEALFLLFIKLYDEMLARKKFETSTDIHEFIRIQRALPEHDRMLILICEDKGIPISGVVATAMGDSGIYLFGATSDAGMQSKGAYLLQWTVVKWLKEKGLLYYNLGGINPETNPGVYHFKKGFSGDDLLCAQPYIGCSNVLSKAMIKVGTLARGLPRRILRSHK
jgi:hypothetical protein